MATLGVKANIAVGLVSVLVVGAVAAAVLPGFFVVKRSPCLGKLREIGAVQQAHYAEHNRYAASFTELAGFKINPNSLFQLALDGGHPSAPANDCIGCQFVATCRSNVPNRDVWSIASVERTFRGETVPAFSLLHDINGE
ncbi:MAG: hypothetical protein H6Q89_1879 [Myxococcaceae bacterium]|nr:hypothetical protein [Myxococcaceae bacterium]